MDSAYHIFRIIATVVLLMYKNNPGLAHSESQWSSIFLKSKWALPSFQHTVLQVQVSTVRMTTVPSLCSDGICGNKKAHTVLKRDWAGNHLSLKTGQKNHDHILQNFFMFGLLMLAAYLHNLSRCLFTLFASFIVDIMAFCSGGAQSSFLWNNHLAEGWGRFSHLFIYQQILIEYLWWVYIYEKKIDKNSCPSWVYILVGKPGNKHCKWVYYALLKVIITN